MTILQHNHEKKHPLNSTRIAALGLKNLVVAPVSDVHFQAQFYVRLMRNNQEKMDSDRVSESRNTRMLVLQSEPKADVFRSNLENACCRNELENVHFLEGFDSVKNPKGIAESSCDMAITASKFRDLNWISDSTNTQKSVLQLESKAAVLGPGLEKFCCKRELENVHFSEAFDTEKSHKGLAKWGSETTPVVFDLECESHENPRISCRSDGVVNTVNNQIGIAESGSGLAVVVSNLGNEKHENLPENCHFNGVVDTEKTHKGTAEESAVFSAESNLGFCRSTGTSNGILDAIVSNGSLCISTKHSETPRVNQNLDNQNIKVAVLESISQNGVLAVDLENGLGKCHTDKSFSKIHGWSGDSGTITESVTGKENTQSQNSHMRFEKPFSEQIPDSLIDGKAIFDPETGIAAADERNSVMNCHILRNGCKEHTEEVCVAAKEESLNGRNVITHLLPAQDSPKSLQFDQMRGYPASNDAIILATIAKCDFKCSLTHLWTSQNNTVNPDFDQLAASPTGRDVISNGFIVKKLQRKKSNNAAEFEELEFEIAIPPGSALLFPSKKAIGLEAVDFEVKHLVVLDGTWAKANRMYHENPWLKLLPHLKLDPMEKSLYREVRHQPKAGCLSTIESIICALKALGEDSVGLDDLLDVFLSMIRDQRRCKEERLSKESLA